MAARAACRPAAGCGADATDGVQGRWSCWADADALHDGTDYAGLAKLWSRPKRRTSPTGPTSLTAPPAAFPPATRNQQPATEVRARLDDLTWKALRLLHWGLISEKRSERRLARQIMRKWLRVDDCGEVVWWEKPPRQQSSGNRKRPSRKARRRWARRAARRRRVQDFLADLGAPLVLRPIPRRMWCQAQSKPPMDTDERG